MTNDIPIIRMSETQQLFLVDHVDGVRPLIASNLETATRHSLIDMGLVKYHGPINCAPTGTKLTERGRYTLCRLLASYIEALQRVERAKDQSVNALLPKAYVGYGVMNHMRD